METSVYHTEVWWWLSCRTLLEYSFSVDAINRSVCEWESQDFD
jgi:hypothetical protein